MGERQTVAIEAESPQEARTAAISGRHDLEVKWRFRTTRSSGSERNLQAMVRLLAL